MVHYEHMRNRGFTIVELLIVIVVIAILAAITVVAYNGIQQSARDSNRKSDVQLIVKALELYYAENNNYPPGSGSTTINNSWSTTADASWGNLVTALQPYVSKLPRDPISTPNTNVHGGNGYNYAYFAGGYCGVPARQVFILVYRLESGAQQDNLSGDCTTNPLGPYGSGNASNIRTVKR